MGKKGGGSKSQCKSKKGGGRRGEMGTQVGGGKQSDMGSARGRRVHFLNAKKKRVGKEIAESCGLRKKRGWGVHKKDTNGPAENHRKKPTKRERKRMWDKDGRKKIQGNIAEPPVFGQNGRKSLFSEKGAGVPVATYQDEEKKTYLCVRNWGVFPLSRKLCWGKKKQKGPGKEGAPNVGKQRKGKEAWTPNTF